MRINVLKKLLVSAMFLGAVTAWGEAPAGYYSTCEGKSGNALLTALHGKIAAHTTISYKTGLWDLFETSDVRSDGTVWDMYSTKHWRMGAEHCGNYSAVGDCLNKEHSFPKSWFDDRSPMNSDAYHLYPTDGKVNGQRSNYPFGECAGGTTLPSSGNVKALGRLGTSTFPGYTGKVFEPDDEYKGDFARSYFYMATCYNDKIASWSSDMLAGNSYPAFRTWAVELLLKWHRQDPVSQKELDRQEAVAAKQKNRNPYIDYPDLAEHIWGNKKNVAWSSTAAADPQIVMPADGSTLDMGVTAVNAPLQRTITVKGAALSADIAVSLTGAGFSAGSTSLSASAACDQGAELTVSYLSSTAASGTATLTLTSGKAKSTVTLTAKAMTGIPVGAPTYITDRSFVANWVNISGAAATYQFHLWQGDQPVAGYPKSVSASAQSYEVTGLEPTTTYTYQLIGDGVESVVTPVTTGDPVPSIQFLYDGDLYLTATPGVPSDPAEILLDIDNVSTDITISVSAPFGVSTDKATWGTSVKLDPEEDRFYLRVLSDIEGQFTTSLTATAGDYSHDVVVEASVGTTFTFLEDFEADAAGLGNYSGGSYQGTACLWDFKAMGIYAGNSEPHVSGIQAVRFGRAKDGEVAMSMAQDKARGIGTVKFMAKKWNGDADATLELWYSSDQGAHWEKIGEQQCTDDTKFNEFTYTVNREGNGRIKVVRPDGKGSRLNLDDLAISDYINMGVSDLYYHAWDAYCLDSQLVIEGTASNAAVYSTDGILRYSGAVDGRLTLSLAKGLYIVTVDDFARRVLVK